MNPSKNAVVAILKQMLPELKSSMDNLVDMRGNFKMNGLNIKSATATRQISSGFQTPLPPVVIVCTQAASHEKWAEIVAGQMKVENKAGRIFQWDGMSSLSASSQAKLFINAHDLDDFAWMEEFQPTCSVSGGISGSAGTTSKHRISHKVIRRTKTRSWQPIKVLNVLLWEARMRGAARLGSEQSGVERVIPNQGQSCIKQWLSYCR